MHGHRDIQRSLDASTGIAARPSRVRLLILALLTLGTLINYLDRTVISVAAPLMQTTWVSRPIPEDRPSDQELFGEFYNTETL